MYLKRSRDRKGNIWHYFNTRHYVYIHTANSVFSLKTFTSALPNVSFPHGVRATLNQREHKQFILASALGFFTVGQFAVRKNVTFG